MSGTLIDLVYSLGSCLACFPSSPTLKIHGRGFKILRLLGEGGFSYVYLVQDSATAELFALKKIRCPFGVESIAQAMREVDAYRLFTHADGIIHSVDYCVTTERGGGGGSSGGNLGGGDTGPAKTVYILLPYYRRGNLQDLINANLVNHAQFPETHLLRLFLGVCRALRAMHHYSPDAGGERMTMPGGGSGGADGSKRSHAAADDTFEVEQQRPLMADEAPTVTVTGTSEDSTADHGTSHDTSHDASHGTGSTDTIRSYAHRDIKPANIMVEDDGVTPVLMDLGSLAASPLVITSRSLAIATQDVAAEHSTMPYRAPELFDVKTDAVIDTKVDIWSLGCTLYACLVGKSPFELRSDETGGSLAICVLGGDWRFPDEGPGAAKKAKTPQRAASAQDTSGSGASAAVPDPTPISEPVREVVRRCLRVEPAERPDIDELIQFVEETLEQLSS